MDQEVINTECYEALGERWYTAYDDPVALLRAESKLRNPWIIEKIRAKFGSQAAILDVGCGAGFLSNPLGAAGFQVTGIDLSNESLTIAKRYDTTSQIKYLEMDAKLLGFPDKSFDVVCAMDFLEHVTDPKALITEISRVLKPGGLFFFHTFNRSPLSWLVVIKGVEWFVRNTPKNLHLYSLFLKPIEVTSYCEENGVCVEEIRGMRPKLSPKAFFSLATTRRVPEKFEFVFTKSLATGYLGVSTRLG